MKTLCEQKYENGEKEKRYVGYHNKETNKIGILQIIK